MGIVAIYPGPNLSRRTHQAAVAPYLLRHRTPAYPNHVWAIDITYIRLTRSWLYLVAVIDWYSRYIVSWALDDTLGMPFVLDAVDQALEQATPVIWNSDQGSVRRMTARVIVRNAPQVRAETCEVTRLTRSGNTYGNTARRERGELRSRVSALVSPRPGC
jgi:transposase InsO family protein